MLIHVAPILHFPEGAPALEVAFHAAVPSWPLPLCRWLVTWTVARVALEREGSP